MSLKRIWTAVKVGGAVVALIILFVTIYNLFTRPPDVELTAAERERPAIVDRDGRRWLELSGLGARLTHPGPAFDEDLAAARMLGGDARSRTFVYSDPESKAVFIVWIAKRGRERARFEAFFSELKDVARSIAGGGPLTPEKDALRWETREARFEATSAEDLHVSIGLWGGLGASERVSVAVVAMAPREHPIDPPTLERL